MKIKDFTLTLTFLFIFTCFWTKAQFYNEDEKLGLKAFLRQPSAIADKLNLQVLGLSVLDTLNWDVSEAWLFKLHEPQSVAYFDWEWDFYSPSGLKRLEVKTFDDSNTRLSGVLDCSYFSRLEYLDCSNSSITGLNISGNTNLRYLDCSTNELSDLDVSNPVLLTHLNCANNKISSLDLSNNLGITHLNCANNLLKDLNLYYNYVLMSLICSNNQMQRLTLPALSNYLEVLDCSNNLLSDIDVSHFSGLKLLALDNNKLNNIDLSNNQQIESLYNSGNELQDIDISQNNYLTLLNVSENKLEDLNVQANLRLRFIYAAENQLQNLDLSSNELVEILKVNNNELEVLDLSDNFSLTELDCSFNNLSLIATGSSANPVVSLVYNNNSLLFSKMPLDYISGGTKVLKYAPQNEIDGGEVSCKETIDLSREHIVKGLTTTYNWHCLTDGNPFMISTLGSGKFSIMLNEDNLYMCDLTNPFFPGLTLHYKIMSKKDTIVDVQGKTVSGNLIHYDKESALVAVEATEGDKVKSISLYDTLGRNAMHSEGKAELSTYGIQPGVYVIKVVFASGKYISKKITI